MDSTTWTAMISAGTAVVVVSLTNFFRRREDEADWRKMKLERYREYILALSATVKERVTPEAQARYSDAVNGLQLVAPPPILRALDAFIAHTSFRNPDKAIDRHDQLLTVLIREMRRDLQPSYRGDEGVHFRLLGVPPPESPQGHAQRITERDQRTLGRRLVRRWIRERWKEEDTFIYW